jgi:hypothetical protein
MEKNNHESHSVSVNKVGKVSLADEVSHFSDKKFFYLYGLCLEILILLIINKYDIYYIY